MVRVHRVEEIRASEPEETDEQICNSRTIEHMFCLFVSTVRNSDCPGKSDRRHSKSCTFVMFRRRRAARMGLLAVFGVKLEHRAVLAPALVGAWCKGRLGMAEGPLLVAKQQHVRFSEDAICDENAALATDALLRTLGRREEGDASGDQPLSAKLAR